MAKAMSMDPSRAEHLIKQAHTIPDQAGQVFAMAKPRMAALWHLDLRPGVDQVLEEISAHYSGAVVASRDLTVFNVTRQEMTARQAQLDPAAPILRGPTQDDGSLDQPNVSPAWWPDALLDI